VQPEVPLLSVAIRQYIDTYIWQHNYSHKTTKNYEWAVSSFLKAVEDKPITEITQADIITWRRYMESKQYTIGAVNAYLYRVRCLLKYYGKHLKLSIDPDEIIIPKKEKKLPKVLTRDQIIQLVSHADLRGQVIIAVLYSSGIRVGELSRIKIRDIIGDTIKVRGKGSKERLVFLDDQTLALIQTYLKTRNDVSPFLLYSKKGSGLGISAIQRIVRDAGRRAGIGDVTPHVLRHSFATHMVQQGCGAFHLQKILGHEHISTTQIYVNLGDKDVYNAHKKFHKAIDKHTSISYNA